MSGRDALGGLVLEQPGPAFPAQDSLAGHGPLPGVVLGELVALVDEGRCPLVSCAVLPHAGAVRARSLVDLEARHIGHTVALVFERGDPARPVVTGLLQGEPGWPLADPPGQVQVEADGARMTVSARRELVLRCGKASITLSEDGRVEIRGETIHTRAVGANRIRGGSIELN
jgi:hypothetical protein